MSAAFRLDPNEHDRFILRQRFRPVVNEYEFSLPQDGSDEPGQPFCFVRQRRFKFKEDIRFFADDSRSVELMRIKARQRFDPGARYDVTAADGSKIGEIQKVFGASLLRSTYRLYDADGVEVASNVGKHAPGSHVRVAVVYGSDDVRVEVCDHGGTAPARDLPGSGNGLVGMRERVGMFGGSFEAAQQASGGFRVAASFPLPAAAP